ncbi:MAG: hypothetical protein H0U67_15905 [Gemmatimonadetes bacterium]|nr:hypothetical protein [Gemmatimonadota bacterium]
MNRSRAGALLVILVAVIVSGCGHDEPQPAPVVGGEPVAEGLSPEEIRQRAEPMTPEQAEQLGIVDTTIHVEEQETPEDTLLRRDTLPRPGAPRP